MNFPNEKISQLTFFKYIPNNFISPKKRTDICPICSKKQKITQALNNTNNNFSSENEQKLNNELKIIDHHQKIINHQKNQFNFSKENLEKGECILIMDFKENMKLGCGPDETKMDFFQKKQISVLGISMIYKKE